MAGNKIIVLNHPRPAGVVMPIRVVTLPNPRDTILHLVKDQACYKPGIISPEYRNRLYFSDFSLRRKSVTVRGTIGY